jgi:hypothetical protein
MHNLVTLSSWAAWEEPGFPDGYNTSLCNGILKTVNGYMSYAGSVWTQSEVTHTLTDQQVYTVVEQAWALSSLFDEGYPYSNYLNQALADTAWINSVAPIAASNWPGYPQGQPANAYVTLPNWLQIEATYNNGGAHICADLLSIFQGWGVTVFSRGASQVSSWMYQVISNPVFGTKSTSNGVSLPDIIYNRMTAVLAAVWQVVSSKGWRKLPCQVVERALWVLISMAMVILGVSAIFKSLSYVVAAAVGANGLAWFFLVVGASAVVLAVVLYAIKALLGCGTLLGAK